MKSLEERDVVLVGDDTDLLILALHEFKLVAGSKMLYMFRSGAFVNIKQVLSVHNHHVVENVLAIHALSGCDTVSKLAGIGKNKLVKLVEKTPSLAKDLKKFSKAGQSNSKIVETGCCILSYVYGIRTASGSTEEYEDLRPLLVYFFVACCIQYLDTLAIYD